MLITKELPIATLYSVFVVILVFFEYGSNSTGAVKLDNLIPKKQYHRSSHSSYFKSKIMFVVDDSTSLVSKVPQTTNTSTKTKTDSFEIATFLRFFFAPFLEQPLFL